jgi:hypothetical protein
MTGRGGGGELNGDYQVIRGSEECLSEIGDARQTRHCLHKQNGSLLTGPR